MYLLLLLSSLLHSLMFFFFDDHIVFCVAVAFVTVAVDDAGVPAVVHVDA